MLVVAGGGGAGPDLAGGGGGGGYRASGYGPSPQRGTALTVFTDGVAIPITVGGRWCKWNTDGAPGQILSVFDSTTTQVYINWWGCWETDIW